MVPQFSARQFEKNIFQPNMSPLTSDLFLEIIWGIEGDNFPIIDYGNPVADFRLLHVVGSEENGRIVFSLGCLQMLPNVGAGLRVKANRWLVQKEDFGFMDKSPSNLESPLHSSRIRFHNVVSAFIQTHHSEESLNALFPHFTGDAVEIRMENHVIHCRQFFIETGILKDDPDVLPNFIRLFCDIDSCK